MRYSEKIKQLEDMLDQVVIDLAASDKIKPADEKRILKAVKALDLSQGQYELLVKQAAMRHAVQHSGSGSCSCSCCEPTKTTAKKGGKKPAAKAKARKGRK